jgi:hypothetical protein
VVTCMAIRVTKRDGSVVQASSWSAWRQFAPLHKRRQCPACDGTGQQVWMIEASDGHPTRWLPAGCGGCKGKGWVWP